MPGQLGQCLEEAQSRQGFGQERLVQMTLENPLGFSDSMNYECCIGPT